MRYAAKIDANQPEIVTALRAAGCSVQLLHRVGGGCPDLLVGNWKGNHILEVKDGSLPPSQRQLTDDQIEWHASWKGKVFIVSSVEEALAVVS